MSTVSKSRRPEPPSGEPDPFRYGWRYVRVERPGGRVDLDQVPLTLEDVLFPEVGDFIVQSTPHNRDVVYLEDVCESRLADNPHAEVVSDCRVDWNLPGVRPLGPDIALFLEVRQHKNRSTIDVAAEGIRPAMVVEVTSPDTRNNDLKLKRELYRRARIPLYVIADAVRDDEKGRRLKLFAYRYAGGHYVKVRPDARGWIRQDPVALWLGVAVDPRTGGDRLVCYDDRGVEVGDYTAVSQALAAESEARARAEQQAAAESEARARAEDRIRELEAALRRKSRP